MLRSYREAHARSAVSRVNAERQLKIVHHRLRAADRLLGKGCPVAVEQGHATGYFDQLHRLVETGAEQALLRRARGVPGKELLLHLLQPLLIIGGEPQLQVSQESPDVVCRVGQAAAVEID